MNKIDEIMKHCKTHINKMACYKCPFDVLCDKLISVINMGGNVPWSWTEEEKEQALKYISLKRMGLRK